MSETILVTGGGGFIGTWVVRELLERGLIPIVYDLHRNEERWSRILGEVADNVAFVAGDLVDKSRLEQTSHVYHISRIIHLGALLTPACQDDPWLGCQANVLGSVAIFELARTAPDRIVSIAFASSLAVYGPEPDDEGWIASEIDSTHAPNFYGVYKRSVELIAAQYWRHFKIPSFGLRPHVVYGPERTSGLTAGPSLAARAAAENDSYCINYTGPAGYDYVEDVASAFVRGALETPAGSNVVDLPSQQATTEQIVDMLGDIVPGSRGQICTAGGPIPSNTPARLHLITELFPDWTATLIAEGLQKTVEFYNQHAANLQNLGD